MNIIYFCNPEYLSESVLVLNKALLSCFAGWLCCHIMSSSNTVYIVPDGRTSVWQAICNTCAKVTEPTGKLLWMGADLKGLSLARLHCEIICTGSGPKRRKNTGS